MTDKKQAYYHSDNGVNMIRALVWTPQEAEKQGVVQLVPSFGDHTDRYDGFARFLADNGYVVCGADHVGHGFSVESPFELGAVNDNAHLTVIRDMNTLHRIMAKKYPDLPYYMIGMGVGAFAARVYTGAFADTMAGAVFVGCGQAPDFLWALKDPAEAILARLPAEVSSSVALGELFGRFTKRFYNDRTELSWLARSDEALEEYISDPLTGFQMTKELQSALVMLLLKGSDRRNAQLLPSDFKVMFVSGAKDSVGFFGRAVIAASDIYAAEGLEPEVILYPADRHDLLHEPDKEKVYEDILKFLRS